MDAAQGVRVIHLPNLLAGKLGCQPGEGIMEELLKTAETKVQELVADYLIWVDAAAASTRHTPARCGASWTSLPGSECVRTRTCGPG